MASVLDPSGDRTARLMVGYSALLTALPFVATYAGMLHPYGALVALPANGKLLWDSVQFYGKRSNANAKAAFHTSLWFVLQHDPPVMCPHWCQAAFVYCWCVWYVCTHACECM